MKKLFIFFFIFFNGILNAQNDTLEKVIIEFNRFKYPDTKYYIDFKKNEVQCVMKYKISDDITDKIISDKTYKFSNEQFINFKNEINKFYFYYFQLPSVQEHFHNVATGSTIKNLSLKSIQDFEEIGRA